VLARAGCYKILPFNMLCAYSTRVLFFLSATPFSCGVHGSVYYFYNYVFFAILDECTKCKLSPLIESKDIDVFPCFLLNHIFKLFKVSKYIIFIS